MYRPPLICIITRFLPVLFLLRLSVCGIYKRWPDAFRFQLRLGPAVFCPPARASSRVLRARYLPMSRTLRAWRHSPRQQPSRAPAENLLGGGASRSIGCNNRPIHPLWRVAGQGPPIGGTHREGKATESPAVGARRISSACLFGQIPPALARTTAHPLCDFAGGHNTGTSLFGKKMLGSVMQAGRNALRGSCIVWDVSDRFFRNASVFSATGGPPQI